MSDNAEWFTSNSGWLQCNKNGLGQYATIGTFTGGISVSYSGTKPLVICNGTTTEAKDMNDAQSIAERLAHQHQADAFILKPVTKVSPKREVVTTPLTD